MPPVLGPAAVDVDGPVNDRLAFARGRHAPTRCALWWYMVAPDAMTVRLLGRPAVLLEEGWVEPPPGRASALLYYLAFHGGWVGRSDLVYLFWPDAPETEARGHLRTLLFRLAAKPYARGLEREWARVRWSVTADVQAFRHALEARRWREAWELGRHELLSGFTVARAQEFEAWLEAERSELRVAARRAGLLAVDAQESEGDLVGASVVAAALHRDDPLDEAATRRHLVALARAGERSAALAAFEAFRRLLADEVGSEPEDETVRLVEAIRKGSGANQAVRDAVTAGFREPVTGIAGEIPYQPTRFVGREREVDALTGGILDDACRLLTLVGPGGVGKTRLAIEVASRVAPRFEQGARFVDLAGIRTRATALAAVAAAVGAETHPDAEGVLSLAEHLRHARMLVVLDNMEQLVEAARELVTELMARAPQLKFLATSRVRLGYRGERVFDLAGLPFEDPTDGTLSDAATVFVRAARRLRPDLEFSRAELELVTRICALVGGLPLGLELAATWLRVLDVAEIEAELASSPRLLEGPGSTIPRRHGSMRAVFDHSWSLLRPHEKLGLRALAAFHGGWTREAATAVAAVGMPVLLALRDASLIWRDASGRFGWHPLIGQYAGELADEHPAERDAALGRHARYYLRLLAERQSAWIGHEGARHLAEVEAETANLEAACRWAIARRDTALLAEAIPGFQWLIIASARVGLFVRLVREVVATAEPGSLLHARALVCLGAAATWRGVGGVTEGLIGSLREAIDVLQRHDAFEDAVHAHRFLGMACLRLGRVPEAREIWQRARVLHQALGDAEGVTMMLNNLGDTAPTFDEAVAGLRAAIAYGLETGALFPAALASDGLGHTLFRRHGASPEAVSALEQAVDLSARTGFRHVEQHGRRLLAEVLAASGDLAAAQAAIELAVARRDISEGEQAIQDLVAARAVQAWVAWLAGDRNLADQSAQAALERSTELPAATAVLPPTSMALACLVLGRLALERGDATTAAVELARARSWLERIVAAPGTWHDAMGEEPEALAWTRLLAAECDLALATSRVSDARDVAVEALGVALRSEQGPAGAMALVIAAGILAATVEVDVAREALACVERHPATPFEAARMAERLVADRPGLVPLAAAEPAAHDAASSRSLAATLEAALGRLRTR